MMRRGGPQRSTLNGAARDRHEATAALYQATYAAGEAINTLPPAHAVHKSILIERYK
jgi:hypothetical protein